MYYVDKGTTLEATKAPLIFSSQTIYFRLVRVTHVPPQLLVDKTIYMWRT